MSGKQAQSDDWWPLQREQQLSLESILQLTINCIHNHGGADLRRDRSLAAELLPQARLRRSKSNLVAGRVGACRLARQATCRSAQQAAQGRDLVLHRAVISRRPLLTGPFVRPSGTSRML